VPFLSDAKLAVKLIRNSQFSKAAAQLAMGKDRYPKRNFFFDLHGMNTLEFPTKGATRSLACPENQLDELTERMSANRYALFAVYENYLALRHAVFSSNDKLRVDAKSAAMKWHAKILNSCRNSHPTTILSLGLIFHANRQYDKAISVFETFLANSLYRPVALCLLLSCGDKTAPLSYRLSQYVDEFLDSNFSRPAVLPTFPGVFDDFDTAAKLNSVIVLGNRYAADKSRKHLDKAHLILDSVAAPHRATAGYWITLGEVLIFHDDQTQAQSAFEQSLKIEETAAALAGLASVCRRLGQYKRSLDYSNRALHIEPTHFTARTCKGVILHELGRHEEAIPILTAAVQQQPSHILAVQKLGEALVASDTDQKLGNSLISFASQLRSGKGGGDDFVLSALDLLGDIS